MTHILQHTGVQLPPFQSAPPPALQAAVVPAIQVGPPPETRECRVHKLNYS
jgi:hypothetical protein